MKRRDLERHLAAHGCRTVGGTKLAKWRGPRNEVSALPRHEEIGPGLDKVERGVTSIHLLGAFSNPDTETQPRKLDKLRRRILANTLTDPPSPSSPPRRIGDVPEAIIRVLSTARNAMHVSEIHRAVEQELGRSVNYRTVKGSLSAGARMTEPRFERTTYGEYRLAQ